MGAVIGHELTHGFDDNGAKFSSDGRMINWWTNEDKKKFDERTQKLIDQYNSFEVLDNVFVNGKLTLGGRPRAPATEEEVLHEHARPEPRFLDLGDTRQKSARRQTFDHIRVDAWGKLMDCICVAYTIIIFPIKSIWLSACGIRYTSGSQQIPLIGCINEHSALKNLAGVR